MNPMRIAFAVCLAASALAQPAEPGASIVLREGWAIESSARVRDSGAAISMPRYNAREWYPAAVPSTVFNALVSDSVYPDPYFAMNLRAASGVTYPIAHNFSNIPMPPDSPFRASWWYRTEFAVPETYRGQTVWLRFDGINYRGNVWLNGRQIAAADKMAGAWRIFEYAVTAAVRPGAQNALAVEIFPPQPGDLAITFVDWNPQPPDKSMGIWRPVSLHATGPVALRWPQVSTKLNLPAADAAQLTVTAELLNASPQPVSGVLKGKIESLDFSQEVRLAPRETRVVAFTPGAFPQLRVAQPKLWWPVYTGPHNLYPLELSFETGGKTSDRAALRFGIREVTSQIDDAGHRRFQINGHNILVRGAGYTFDMLLRSSPERQEAELNYVRDMNLNAVRLEGKLEDEHFLDLADENGILVLAGWCCCDAWEKWDKWSGDQRIVAVESLKDQIRRLRSHASLFNWMTGSDNPPPPEIEKAYLAVLKEYNWPNPYESSATQQPTPVTGPTGVKMTGPYEYVAPSYWLLDKTRGGAHGFNTETGPGPAVPPVESLRRMLPEDHWWPINSFWNYHTGGGPFRDIKVFTQALNARYGPAETLEDFARKAQVLAYESHRAMFEAFGRNKYTSTGVVQWMLNNAWPSMIWHLYDWYLRPGGSYFGAKKANEPLHVQYSYDDRSVAVVNSYYRAFPAMKVSARVYNLDMAEKFSRQADVDLGPDSVVRAFTLPAINGLTGTYFLRLDLTDPSGKTASTNFYWLSTKPEELDWDRSTWYYTPTKSFADFTALERLPKAELNIASASDARGADRITRVTIENPSRHLAFAIRLKVNRASEGEEILPVLWDDNYFSLLPGEKREVAATYRAKDLGKAQPVVEVEAWNVPRRTY